MASDHMIYEGQAQSITLPTTEGSIGILAQHSNLIMAVVPGSLEFVPAGKSAQEAGLSGKQTIVVSNGLLKVENGEVMVLVDTAERPEDIDEARARRAEEKAREDLRSVTDTETKETRADELSAFFRAIAEAWQIHYNN